MKSTQDSSTTNLPDDGANDQQQFGDSPTDVRDTDHYTEEYVTGFVDKWDELIDWDKRADSEGRFFIDQLKSRDAKTVLDVATGTGFHSVRLLEEGFETVSADGSADMLTKAFENARARGGHILRVVHADWRWLNRDVQGTYDAIICLGNSFTHLFSENDRRKALAEFYSMLSHNGVLILDQRNYDALLDGAYSNRHTYYYCGNTVTAEPEYVDDGLARFCYTFPDTSQYHLNMYPLRRDYVRTLMREVGFAHVETYSDFQDTHPEGEPDFFIHVAEKAHRRPDKTADGYSSTVHTARDYYNSEDADTFYSLVWGGEDIHVGLYAEPGEDIATASRRTVTRMADPLDLGPDTRVLDLGSGFGGAARHLSGTYGCHTTCLNLSEVENARNRELTADAGLSDLIEVVDGSFEDLPFEDNRFDVVWSQDALLHSGDRVRVLQEAVRVLRPGGRIVFTDPMAADGCPREALTPILQRLHLDTMASPEFYRRTLVNLGLTVEFDDQTEQLTTHYQRVLEETEHLQADLAGRVSTDYLDRMRAGLRHWVDGGRSGNLAWGVFVAG